MNKNRIIKAVFIYAALAGLGYYRFGPKTAMFLVLMLFTVNLTIVIVPEISLVLMRRRTPTTSFYLKLVLWLAGILGCFISVPFKALAGMTAVTVLIAGFTTWYTLKNNPD